MSGFESTSNGGAASDRVQSAPKVSDLSPEQVNEIIARAHRMRSAYLTRTGRQFFRNLASVWRRPGRLAPVHPARV
jgi:hypothetical protein